jgi:hypothetical protein
VLLDTGQVASSTFIHSKTVIQELFGTLRPADRINVVTFDSTHAALLQPTSVTPTSFNSLFCCYWHRRRSAAVQGQAA